MRGKLALLTAAVSLASAATAQAAQVGTFGRDTTHPAASRGLSIIGPGAITVTLEGATSNADHGPATLLPTSIVVSDPTGSLDPGTSDCVALSASSARCSAAQGFDFLNAYGITKFDVGAAGALTPIEYSVTTTDGDDAVTIPTSIAADISTLGGGDDITIGQTSDLTYVRVDAGAGDDTIKGAGVTGSLDCGDGSDIAVWVFATSSETNCESG
jgi:hypothetical protein